MRISSAFPTTSINCRGIIFAPFLEKGTDVGGENKIVDLFSPSSVPPHREYSQPGMRYFRTLTLNWCGGGHGKWRG